MPQELSLLLVEDSEDDASLVPIEQSRGGLELTVERVDTRGEMVVVLEHRALDMVISHHSMPTFDALAALTVIRERALDLPLLVVSGTIDEEAAVAAMKAGAQDYISKAKLVRLVPAVERELREKASRRDKRRAEERALQSEDRYRLLFESCPLPMWVYDLETLAFLAVNESAVRHYGYSQEEFASMTLADIRPPEDVPALRDHVAALSGRDDGRVWRHRKKDGSIISVDIKASDFRFESRAARLVLAHDVTDRRHLEEQLRHAQKMEAVGRLAGGVAHDFNNLLSVIASYAQLTLLELPEASPLWSDVDEIRKAGERAAELTRQLLAFSRQQVLAPTVLDLNTILSGMEGMLSRLLGGDVSLNLVRSSSLGRIRADAGQVEQVVMNLAVNARDAMPAGGTLTIETSNVTLDEGAYVMLAVSDTGVGIDETEQVRIFEPFFTTKEKGKGTGLGLSTVFGIVQQSGGRIWVESEVGKGATFKVRFARVEDVSDPMPARTAPPEALAPSGAQTILLVEDDEQVRAVAKAILRRHGYRVLETMDAGGALLTCEKHRGNIDLLLTDVILPHMNGRELVERAILIRPDMRVLFMSGYTAGELGRDGVIDADLAFIQKPITPESLIRKVREVLR